MNLRKFVYSFSALCLPIATFGCGKLDELPYCYGINERNLPARLVIVESAANADFYRLPADEWRIDPESTPPSERIVVEDGRLIAYLPSCKNIDGMDTIGELALSDGQRTTGRESLYTYCVDVFFDAETPDSPLVMTQDAEGLGAAGWDSIVSSLRSSIAQRPGMLQNLNAGANVLLSPSHVRSDGPPFTAVPLSHDELYMTEGERGEPPVIIARQWVLENTPEASDAMAYLGIETDDDYVVCADYYYGYFAE